MKRCIIRALSLVLAMPLTLGIFSSCGQTAADDPADTGEQLESNDNSRGITMGMLAERDISEYSIVIPKSAPRDMIDAGKALRVKLNELFDVKLKLWVKDSSSGPAIRLELVEGKELEYEHMEFVGEELVLSGGHYLAVVDLCDKLFEQLSTSGLAADYTFTGSYSGVPLKSERYADYVLTWGDEFDGESSQYNRNKWTQRACMAQSDIYNSSTERNVRVEDGNLVLNSWKEEDTSISDGKPYSTNTSMTTYNSCNFMYGYLEMRAIVPFGKGCWPSFWMQTRKECRPEGSEYMAETDIFEVFASKDTVVPNIHKWYGAEKSNYHVQLDSNRKKNYKFTDIENLSNEYHTYGFYWDEKEMVFSVDGEDYCSIDITEETGDFGTYKGMEGFHCPAFIILNNFLFTDGSSWKPANSVVADDQKYPVEYKIDYIRLYQGENGKLVSMD